MICDIQQANWWKRLSAWLLDAILVVIIATGFILLTAKICDYDGNYQKLEEKYTYYEETYGVSFDLTDEEYQALSEEDVQKYNQVQELINKDEEFINIFRKLILLTILILSIGIFFGIMIIEFVLPLIFKNGQTLGKKIFGLCVIRNDSVKASNIQLFIRALIGKFVVETMVPVLLIVLLAFKALGIEALIGLFVIFVIQMIMYFSGRYHQVLHDRLSLTLVADKESQMIFKSYDEMIKYKQDKAKEDSIKESNYLY